MRTIAIILGDNDFGNTFIPLLESIGNAIEFRRNAERDELSPEILTKTIHEGIKFHYLAYQVRYDLEAYESTDDCDKIICYLDKIRILFDEEAEADILTEDRDGGAWYLQNNIVRSY